MRFIQKWSYACADHMSTMLGENHQKRSAYYFGFQIIIGSIVKYALTIVVALLLGILVPMLVVMGTFTCLRLIAGGYHMDTYGKCLFVSSGLFVAASLIARYTYAYWNTVFIFVLIAAGVISGLYVLIRYAPRDTPNKPITDPKEIRKFKTLSLVFLFAWLVLSIFLAVLDYKMAAISLCFGLLLELFAISPTGHRFFDLINKC